MSKLEKISNSKFEEISKSQLKVIKAGTDASIAPVTCGGDNPYGVACDRVGAHKLD